MMRHLAMMFGIVGAVGSAPAVHAQQSQGKSPEARMMQMVDSLDHRLDSLVDRMNRASGNQKIAAMAAVINELVVQRKVMHGHMQQMHGRTQPMMLTEPPGMRGMASPPDTTRAQGPRSGQ